LTGSPTGEVSPFLTEELMLGETIEIRGPVGGFFVWEQSLGGPILLVGGGSGVVPMRSMLRHWANLKHEPTCARLLYSVRTPDDIIYQRELEKLQALENVDVKIALTQEWPAEWQGLRGRIDKSVLEATAWSSGLTYICGPAPFVEAMASALVELGHDGARIKTERFGPTGT
jgi:ferredoxin-NADP reductase